MPSHNGEMSRVGAIVVAAGESRRMGGQDKIFATVLGRPLLSYSIDAMEVNPHVQEIVLVLPASKIEAGWCLVEGGSWRKVTHICPGGERRQDSVRCGLERLSPCHWVVVHDGARPCLDPELVSLGLEAAAETGAAVAAVPAKDTIKQATSTGLVVRTLDREGLWMVQTPQVFRYSLLVDSHQNYSTDVTDDAAMVEGLGHRVKVFTGSYANLKVTTSDDLVIAESLLRGHVPSHGK